jgi:HD-like signal output (HDOD) protein
MNNASTAISNSEPSYSEASFDKILQGMWIPPRPRVVAQLDAEIRRDEPDTKKIEDLIGQDAGTAAELLKIANSPLYGLRMKSSTVRQAISLLGLKGVARVVTGLALRNLSPKAHADVMERFWQESAEIALVSSFIAKRLPGVDKDLAFTFGLFQDCGIPLLLGRFPGYRETLDIAEISVDKSFSELEIERHRISHTYLGSMVAKTWGLPDSITTAIRYHHDYPALSHASRVIGTDSQDFIALALLAEHAVRFNSGFDRKRDWAAGGHLALEHFGLSEDDFHGLADEVQEMLSEAHNDND